MYKVSTNGSIKRLRDGAAIPLDAGNRDYREFTAWIRAGNMPVPADAPPPKPSLAAYAHDKLTNDYLLHAILSVVAAKLNMQSADLVAAVVAQVDANDKAPHDHASPASTRSTNSTPSTR